jgi:hypothetical protein
METDMVLGSEKGPIIPQEKSRTSAYMHKMSNCSISR